jgi:hypothetical protein
MKLNHTTAATRPCKRMEAAKEAGRGPRSDCSVKSVMEWKDIFSGSVLPLIYSAWATILRTRAGQNLLEEIPPLAPANRHAYNTEDAGATSRF